MEVYSAPIQVYGGVPVQQPVPLHIEFQGSILICWTQHHLLAGVVFSTWHHTTLLLLMFPLSKAEFLVVTVKKKVPCENQCRTEYEVAIFGLF